MTIRFGRKKCMIILVSFLLENLFRVVDTTTVNFFYYQCISNYVMANVILHDDFSLIGHKILLI